MIPRRSSLSISRRVSTGSQFATRSVSHQKNVNSTNTCTMEIQLETLLKEVDNLKSMNNDVLGSLAKLTELTTLLAGFRDENVLLRQTNERLIAENRQLRLSLRAVENKQTNTDAIIISPSTATSDPIPTNADLQTDSDDRTMGDVSPANVMSAGVVSTLSRIGKHKWLKVSNLSPATTCEAVLNHVVLSTSVSRSSVVCSLLTPKTIINPFFASFKVGVPEDAFDRIFRNEAWPPNTEV